MKNSRYIGWVLIAIIFLIWFQINNKQLEGQRALQKARNDSLNLVTYQRDTIASAYQPALQAEINPATIKPAESEVLTRDSVIQEQKISVITNKFIVTLSNRGAKVTSIVLKDLKGRNDKEYPELLANDTTGALSLTIGSLDLSDIVWDADAPVQNQYEPISSPVSINFSTYLANGTKIQRNYTFFPDSQFFHHQFVPEQLPVGFSLNWESGLRETEHPVTGKGIGINYSFFSEVVINDGSIVTRDQIGGKTLNYNKDSGVLNWIGLRRKYVAGIINFNRQTQHSATAKEIPAIANSGYMPTASLEITKSELQEGDLDFDFVILPLRYKQLTTFKQNYEKIIFSGVKWFFQADVWYSHLCGWVFALLQLFYSLIPNYGIAIILLTLLVRTGLLPLTIAQTRSMSKMQEHAPAIKQIREKFKSNPQKMNQEVMKYYKDVGVNPLAQMMGCFPLVLQMPVFISLFHVLGRSLELKEAPFFGWITDLSQPDVILEGFKIPFLFPMGLTILPIFMAATMYFQMKMTITDPNQKAMVALMPGMMFLFCASFPSGLVLYWTVSNIYTIVQTRVLKKNNPLPTAVPGVFKKKK